MRRDKFTSINLRRSKTFDETIQDTILLTMKVNILLVNVYNLTTYVIWY